MIRSINLTCIWIVLSIYPILTSECVYDWIRRHGVAAKILGRTMAPETYRDTKENNGDKFGVNFAVGGAGVFEVPRKAPTLAKQIDSFKKMLDDSDIGKWQLRESVALVAISGNDYARVANMSGESEILDFIGNVTDEIAGGVERLRKQIPTKPLPTLARSD